MIEKAAGDVSDATPATIDGFTELALLLEERERGSWLAAPELPRRLSASKVMQLITDPEAFANYLARPMPQVFSAIAQRGTDFHRLLEEHWVQDTELADQDWAEEDLELRANFENSRFANLTPEFVEQSIEFEIAGLIVVCKIDAIFADGDGFLVVDWKSGSSPKTEEELAARAIQLALYRIAFAKWQQIGIEKVSASFFFAADGKEIMPNRLLSEVELVAALEEAKTARRG